MRLALFALLALVVGASLWVFTIAYRVAATYVQPSRTFPDSAPSAVGLSYRDVSLPTRDGLTLAAWYVPSRNGAALILVHGLGANRGTLLDLARDLAAHGYGLLLPDLRAHGQSEGTTNTLGLREVWDIQAATDYLAEQPEVGPDRIGIYGTSLGAGVAIMAAAEIPAIRAVVADSPYASLDWLARNQFEAFSAIPTWLAPLVVYAGGLQAGADPRHIAPVERVARISPRPLLLIHGAEDHMIRVENTYLLAEAARPPTTVWVLPGVPHASAYATHRAEYLTRLTTFFDTALLP